MENSMNLTEEQIAQNWQTLIRKIETNFEGKRKEQLNSMYESFAERMMLAPASGIEHFHNCFPGGYVDHVLRVMDCAEKLHDLWSSMGADMSNYTKEELMFCALNHDLGKVGDKDTEYYVPNPSEWHRKNQGKIYDPNPKIQHMTVPHRSIWLLSNYGITFSQNEMIGILTHDGVYDSANDAYLKPWGKEKALWNNLPIVLHHADHMASRIEYETWKNGNTIKQVLDTKPKFVKKPSTKGLSANGNAQDMFKDLFGEA
tara:strand:+ start:1543 stop:2316 length:774 start_codon:yes stop_codon:yes gene_type:complete